MKSVIPERSRWLDPAIFDVCVVGLMALPIVLDLGLEARFACLAVTALCTAAACLYRRRMQRAGRIADARIQAALIWHSVQLRLHAAPLTPDELFALAMVEGETSDRAVAPRWFTLRVVSLEKRGDLIRRDGGYLASPRLLHVAGVCDRVGYAQPG